MDMALTVKDLKITLSALDLYRTDLLEGGYPEEAGIIQDIDAASSKILHLAKHMGNK